MAKREKLLDSKVCKTCGKTRSRIYFLRDSANEDGMGSNCRDCRKPRRQKVRAKSEFAYKAHPALNAFLVGKHA